MLSHVMVGPNDSGKTKKFYDAFDLMHEGKSIRSVVVY